MCDRCAHTEAVQCLHCGIDGDVVRGLPPDCIGAGELGPVPFLIGGMVPEWIAADKKIRGPIDAVHRSIPSHRPQTAFVEGPAGANGANDGIHFNAAGARELGLRYYRTFSGMAAS